MSLRPTPVKAVVGFELVIVHCRLVVAPTATWAAPNALVIAGGATTVMVVDAVEPVPPSVEVTGLVVLVFAPAVVPVTLTWKTQNVAGPTLAPASVMALAVVVIEPPSQVPISPLGEATARPAGRVSVKPTPVSVVAPLGLLTVNCSIVVPLSGTVAAPNTLEIVGGATTVMVPDAPAPGPASDSTPEVVFVFTPAVRPVTSTLSVQEDEGAITGVAQPNKLTPGGGEPGRKAPHVVLAFGSAATTRPAGKVSLKVTAFSASLSPCWDL